MTKAIINIPTKSTPQERKAYEAVWENLTNSYKSWNMDDLEGLQKHSASQASFYGTQRALILDLLQSGKKGTAIEGQNKLMCFRTGQPIGTLADLVAGLTDGSITNGKSPGAWGFKGKQGGAYKGAGKGRGDAVRHVARLNNVAYLDRTENLGWGFDPVASLGNTAPTPAPVKPGINAELVTVADCDNRIADLLEREGKEAASGDYSKAAATQAMRREVEAERDRLQAIQNKPKPTTERSDLEAALEAAKAAGNWGECASIQAELDALVEQNAEGPTVALGVDAFLAMVKAGTVTVTDPATGTMFTVA